MGVKVEGVEGGWSSEAQALAADQSPSMASFEGMALPKTENHVSDSPGEVKMELPGGVVLKADAKPEADGAVVVEPRGKEQEAMREGEREGQCNGKGKGKVKGVGTSLTELFTSEMIHQHVDSLRHAMSQVRNNGLPMWRKIEVWMSREVDSADGSFLGLGRATFDRFLGWVVLALHSTGIPYH